MNRSFLALSLASCTAAALIAGCGNTFDGMKKDANGDDSHMSSRSEMSDQSSSKTMSKGDMKAAAPAMKSNPNPLRQADPQTSAVVAALESFGDPPVEDTQPAQARKGHSFTDAVMKVMKDKGMDTSPDATVSTDNTHVTGPDGKKVAVRVYRPKDAGDTVLPVIVYIHGGGWVIASVDVYDASCREMAKMVNANVVSVDYDLAPEYKYPAAHDEVYSVLQWALKDASEIKGDSSKVAIMGESAGGNMAAASCLRAKMKGDKEPLAQILVYPVASSKMDSKSYIEEASAKPLNKAMMGWFVKYTFANPTDAESTDINLNGVPKDKLMGLPPATIINAQIDPLRSDGETYAMHLKEAGVDVQQKTFPGVTHEFFGAGKVIDKAMEAETMAATRLKEAFMK